VIGPRILRRRYCRILADGPGEDFVAEIRWACLLVMKSGPDPGGPTSAGPGHKLRTAINTADERERDARESVRRELEGHLQKKDTPFLESVKDLDDGHAGSSGKGAWARASYFASP